MHKWKQLDDCNSTPNLNQITVSDKDDMALKKILLFVQNTRLKSLKNTFEMDAARNTLVSPEDA